jgi:uncharacterized protein YbjQ (UPF0145 family)
LTGGEASENAVGSWPSSFWAFTAVSPAPRNADGGCRLAQPPRTTDNRPVIITTMNDLPGYTIDEVLGEVFGLTVRSRNVGSQIGASLKALVGGELKGMTKLLAQGRLDAQHRLEEEAAAKGANAVVAFRFDTSELGTTWTEICAYGTAVRATRR